MLAAWLELRPFSKDVSMIHVLQRYNLDVKWMLTLLLALVSLYIDWYYGSRYINFFTVYSSPKGGEFPVFFFNGPFFIGTYLKMAFVICGLGAVLFFLTKRLLVLLPFVLFKFAFFGGPLLDGYMMRG